MRRRVKNDFLWRHRALPRTFQKIKENHPHGNSCEGNYGINKSLETRGTLSFIYLSIYFRPCSCFLPFTFNAYDQTLNLSISLVHTTEKGTCRLADPTPAATGQPHFAATASFFIAERVLTVREPR